MNRQRTRRLVMAAACLSVSGGVALSGDLEGVLGGMRYDNWWEAAGLVEPTTTHPLYPPAGSQSGSATWRCAECRGWDYKGVDGAYATGPHFTGIGGVLGSTMTPQQQFDLIKNDHGYGAAGMSDQDIWFIVEFLQNDLIDTDDYISPTGTFFGDIDEGRYNYLAANGFYNCAECHGRGATELADIRAVAENNPWEFLHKVRFSDPGGTMPSAILTGGGAMAAADIGAYLGAGMPGPAYAGDQSCKTCHENSPTPDFFEAYMNSGHPWKITHTGGETPAPDFWPHTPVPPLPVVYGQQLQWSDIEYVIGNYFWKTRFIDPAGYIYTGDADETTQWNLHSQTWVPYHAGAVDKPFNCGRCHTTGYDPEGNQNGLPGLIGTWVQDGVRCEACHGPSSDHVNRPEEMLPPGGKDCDECHYRDAQFRMPWKGGFMRHHQQAEDLLHSPHAGRLNCSSCHDPHRSTVYDDGGTIAHCTDCHPGDASNGYYRVHEMEDVDCIECHMPFMGKSAEATGTYKADIRSHLFQIMTGPVFAVDNVYEDGSSTFWKQSTSGNSYITLDYACLGCHEEVDESLTMEEASAYAANIHTANHARMPMCPADLNKDGLLDLSDITMFAAAFMAHDQIADISGDDLFDLSDITRFVELFTAGCP